MIVSLLSLKQEFLRNFIFLPNGNQTSNNGYWCCSSDRATCVFAIENESEDLFALCVNKYVSCLNLYTYLPLSRCLFVLSEIEFLRYFSPVGLQIGLYWRGGDVLFLSDGVCFQKTRVSNSGWVPKISALTLLAQWTASQSQHACEIFYVIASNVESSSNFKSCVEVFRWVFT